MRFRFFAIPALAPAGAEDELNRFVAEHRVSNVERQLVVDGSASYWAVCVTWVESAGMSSNDPAKRTRVDYKEILAADEFALYDRLRVLRKQRADADGLPAFAVFTNEQLAAMVQQRVTTDADLAKMTSIGESRIERYGDAFLEVLRDGVPRLSTPAKAGGGAAPAR